MRFLYIPFHSKNCVWILKCPQMKFERVQLWMLLAFLRTYRWSGYLDHNDEDTDFPSVSYRVTCYSALPRVPKTVRNWRRESYRRATWLTAKAASSVNRCSACGTRRVLHAWTAQKRVTRRPTICLCTASINPFPNHRAAAPWSGASKEIFSAQGFASELILIGTENNTG